jgi:hypothetical protein
MGTSKVCASGATPAQDCLWRSDGSPSKEGKAKLKFLSDSSAGIAKFPVLMVFFHFLEITSEFANQIRAPIKRGGDESVQRNQEGNG